MAIAARWRGWPVADYFALVVPRRSDFAFGFACMAALLIAFDVLTLRPDATSFRPSCSNLQDGARVGTMVLFFIAVVTSGRSPRRSCSADSCFAA